MVKINEKNILEVVKVLAEYEKAMDYCGECFSTSDIMRARNAEYEFNLVLSELVKNGVNIEKQLAPIDGGKFNFTNGDGFVESKDSNFEIVLKLKQFESYIERIQKKYDWIIEDDKSYLVVKKEHYTELSLGLPRWSFRKWNIDNASINVLTEESSVFRATTTIMDRIKKDNKVCGEENITVCVKSVEEIRDNYAGKDVDCSIFVIALDYPDSKNTANRVTLIVQMGGSYGDVIILNRFNEISRIVPLEGKSIFDTRTYSKFLQDNVTKTLKEFASYRESCL